MPCRPAALGFDLCELGTMAALQPGDPAPPILATAHNGVRVALADYVGKHVVVLYFYPRDNTSICTAEACAFRDSYEDFTKAGAIVIGVSVDSDDSHRDVRRQAAPAVFARQRRRRLDP